VRPDNREWFGACAVARPYPYDFIANAAKRDFGV